MNHSILVIGGGSHHNALGVIRSLGERGYPVELVTIGDLKKNYIAASKYVTKHRPLKHIDELASYLLHRKSRDNTKEVIISCSDQVTEHLGMYQDCLKDCYYLPGIQSKGRMIEVMNKIEQNRLAYLCGIPSPVTWELGDDINCIQFPCIIKSNVSSHGTKDDIVICRAKEQLLQYYSSGKTCFVQTYITKKEEVQFIGCSLNSGRDVLIPGMTRILRSQPNTNTGFLEYGPIDPFYSEIVDKAKQLIKTLQYSGLFSFEILRDKDDTIWFLEINFRNDGNAWCVTKAGINLPVIWVKACLGEDWHDEVLKPQCIRMMPEFQDFKLVLQKKLKLSQWITDWKQTHYFMEYDKNDIKPFYQYILNKIL